MSETSARARRFALALGSLARNGLIGGRAGGPSVEEGVPVRSGAAATGDAARALTGGEAVPTVDDVGRGTPLDTVDSGAAGSGPDDAGGCAGALVPPRGGGDALGGAEAERGAKGAAGAPIGRVASGGVERAPALPELAKGAALDERGDALAAPGPPALAPLTGGRMKGGATAREPAPPADVGATGAAGAAGRPGCATAGAETVAAAIETG